jgi:hypothetical protein
MADDITRKGYPAVPARRVAHCAPRPWSGDSPTLGASSYIEESRLELQLLTETLLEHAVIQSCHHGIVIAPSGPRGDGDQQRKGPPATHAALWAVSNSRCYAPGCLTPVLLEVRPGVYQKNSHVAHIYGMKPKAPRYQPGIPAEARDSDATNGEAPDARSRGLILPCPACASRTAPSRVRVSAPGAYACGATTLAAFRGSPTKAIGAHSTLRWERCTARRHMRDRPHVNQFQHRAPADLCPDRATNTASPSAQDHALVAHSHRKRRATGALNSSCQSPIVRRLGRVRKGISP